MPVHGEQGLFKALYQWGRVKEDFYSNSLVYILKQLRHDENGKRIATEFINSLFTNKLYFLTNEWEIRDHTGNSSRPDIEIESDKYLVYIEVKVQRLDNKACIRLKKYRQKLLKKEINKGRETVLILLTAFGGEKARGIPDFQLSWVKVWEQLAEMEQQLKPEHKENELAPETYYLVRDFRKFLKEQGMGVEKLPQMITAESLENLSKFLEIIRSSCVEAGLKKKDRIGYWGDVKPDEKAIGWYFNEGRKKEYYWCGFYLDNPAMVSFEMAEDACKDLATRMKKNSSLKRRLKSKFPGLNVGEWASFPLDLPDSFVQYSAEKQVDFICNFVRSVLESTGKLKKTS